MSIGANIFIVALNDDNYIACCFDFRNYLDRNRVYCQFICSSPLLANFKSRFISWFNCWFTLKLCQIMCRSWSNRLLITKFASFTPCDYALISRQLIRSLIYDYCDDLQSDLSWHSIVARAASLIIRQKMPSSLRRGPRNRRDPMEKRPTAQVC